MDGYTKLFSSIVTSTVWREPHHIRVSWITLMALANKDGVIQGSIPGVADIARVTIKEFEEALKVFLSPDFYSRSKEMEGRRIIEIDGGWKLVNHRKFRERMNIDERREYKRLKAQEYRARNKQKDQENQEDAECRQNVYGMTTDSTRTQNGHIQKQKHIQTKNKASVTETNNLGASDSTPETKKAQAPWFSDLLDSFFPYLKEKTFAKAFEEFLEMRKRLRKPATQAAQKIILRKLHDYHRDEAEAMLSESIEKCWTTVYPRKKEEAKNGIPSIPRTRKYDGLTGAVE